MCRLLFVRSSKEFKIADHLKPFAEICKNSEEYQGHGWGFGTVENGAWKVYKDIKPVWEDDLDQFGSAQLMVVHARSAFRDEGIAIENNMPFYNNKHLFIFNGELQGVRIKAEGRIGAEKIFNFTNRFLKDGAGMDRALERATEAIKKLTRYVRAMNIIISDKERAFVSTTFGERPGYFTMHCRERPTETVICSNPYPGEDNWQKIENNTCRVF